MTFPRFLWKNAKWLRPLLIELGYDFYPAPPPQPPPLPSPEEDDDPHCEVIGCNYDNPDHVSNGFIWKPVSEGDGNLVVVMPRRLTGLLLTASLPGVSVRVTEIPFDDCRQVFRFPAPGGRWAGTVKLVVRTTRHYLTYMIKGGGLRHENVIPEVA